MEEDKTPEWKFLGQDSEGLMHLGLRLSDTRSGHVAADEAARLWYWNSTVDGKVVARGTSQSESEALRLAEEMAQ